LVVEKEEDWIDERMKPEILDKKKKKVLWWTG
jgi:hypothetical protein